MNKIIITRKTVKSLSEKPTTDNNNDNKIDNGIEKKKTRKSSTVTFDNEDNKTTTMETVKDLSSRWGRAAKYIVKGMAPTITEFAPLWEQGLSSEDPYYDILCREFSYGFFPDNMYFDHHRGAVILSKYTKKKISKKNAKNTSVEFLCNTLFGDTVERTTMARNVTTTNNNPSEMEEEVPTNGNAEHSILEIVNRGASRGEFLVRELLRAGISYHQLYMELKYYLFKVVGILSPLDANKLRQKEEMQQKLLEEANDEVVVSWKKLHVVNKVNYFIQYIKKRVPTISRHKLNFLISWFHVVFLRGDYAIEYENHTIMDIPGLSLDNHGSLLGFDSENRTKKIVKDYYYVLGKYNGFQMTKFWSKDNQ